MLRSRNRVSHAWVAVVLVLPALAGCHVDFAEGLWEAVKHLFGL